MKFKHLLVYGVSLVLLFLGDQSQVSAIGVSMTPAQIITHVDENKHIIPITIKNPENDTLEYFVYATGLGQRLDGDTISLETIDAPFSLIKWIKFNPAKFKLAGGESKIVEAAIQIPKDSSGGLYGIIYVEARPLGQQNGQIIAFPRAGALTLITLPGEARREGKITAVDVVQSRQGEEIHILSTFHNTGNIHLKPEAYVVIRNQAGENIAKVFMDSGTTLPTYSRQFKATWKPENLQVGTYTAISTMIFAGEILIAKKIFEVINTNEIAIVKGEVASFQEIKTVQHKPICFKVLFHNSGNVNLPLGGEIEVKDSKNDIIERVPIEICTAIACSSKEVKAILTKGLPMGTYTAIAKVKYSDEKIATATTDINVIEKEIIRAGEIVELTVPKVEAGEVLILPKLLFKNTGNVTLQVEGMIELENSQGITVGQITIRKAIEPDKIEELGRSWQGELPPGLYRAVATLIFGDGKMITKTSPFLVIGNW